MPWTDDAVAEFGRIRYRIDINVVDLLTFVAAHRRCVVHFSMRIPVFRPSAGVRHRLCFYSLQNNQLDSASCSGPTELRSVGLITINGENATKEIAMTKPDVMWLTARQALVFHRGRIWSMSQEDESAAWVVHVGVGLRGDAVSYFGKLVARFPGGYHAALDWLQKGDFGAIVAMPGTPGPG